MRLILSVFLLLKIGLFQIGFSQTNSESISIQLGNGNLFYGNMVSNPDGTVLITGWSNFDDRTRNSLAPYGANDIWLVKLKSDFTIQWVKSYGSYADETNSCVRVRPNGNLVLACSSGMDMELGGIKYGNGKMDILVMELNADGEKIWEYYYGSADNDNCRTVLLKGDNSILVCGNSEGTASGFKTSSSSGDEDFWIFELNAAGDLKWEKSIGTEQFDYLTDATINSAGDIIMTGTSKKAYSNTEAEDSVESHVLLCSLTSSGELNWLKETEIVPSGLVRIVSNDSDFYVACTMNSYERDGKESSENYFVSKYSNEGDLRWNRSFGGKGSDQVRSLLWTENNQLLLGGYSDSPRGTYKSENARSNYDFWILALNQDGERLWDKTVFSRNEFYLRSICQMGNETYLCAGPSVNGLMVVKVIHRLIALE